MGYSSDRLASLSLGFAAKKKLFITEMLALSRDFPRAFGFTGGILIFTRGARVTTIPTTRG